MGDIKDKIDTLDELIKTLESEVGQLFQNRINDNYQINLNTKKTDIDFIYVKQEIEFLKAESKLLNDKLTDILKTLDEHHDMINQIKRVPNILEILKQEQAQKKD